MVTVTHPPRLILPLATVGAAAAGGLVALAFLLMPSFVLEGMVMRSGIPAVLNAAAPPLGFTARIALGLVCGGGVAGFTWVGLFLLAGARMVKLGDAATWLRRSRLQDAPRPPLFANRDLGTPFLEVTAPVAASITLLAGQALPADLDQPMAAFDPAALPEAPLPAPEPVAPLIRRQLIDPGDRFETFEITPVQRAAAASPKPPSLRVEPAVSLRASSPCDPAATPLASPLAPPPPPAPPPAPLAAAVTEASVHALLARLERGVAGRTGDPGPAIRAGSVNDALGDLRRLAMGPR